MRERQRNFNQITLVLILWMLQSISMWDLSISNIQQVALPAYELVEASLDLNSIVNHMMSTLGPAIFEWTKWWTNGGHLIQLKIAYNLLSH